MDINSVIKLFRNKLPDNCNIYLLKRELVLEVDPKTFLEYRKDCLINPDRPIDGGSRKVNYEWLADIPRSLKVMAITRIINASLRSIPEINKTIRSSKIDILVLPFDWRENEKMKKVVNPLI
jgi:hypothetical protein